MLVRRSIIFFYLFWRHVDLSSSSSTSCPSLSSLFLRLRLRFAFPLSVVSLLPLGHLDRLNHRRHRLRLHRIHCLRLSRSSRPLLPLRSRTFLPILSSLVSATVLYVFVAPVSTPHLSALSSLPPLSVVSVILFLPSSSSRRLRHSHRPLHRAWSLVTAALGRCGPSDHEVCADGRDHPTASRIRSRPFSRGVLPICVFFILKFRANTPILPTKRAVAPNPNHRRHKRTPLQAFFWSLAHFLDALNPPPSENTPNSALNHPNDAHVIASAHVDAKEHPSRCSFAR